jgi:8-oxo-dGTP pyrophosphatase MutT (NUDIX family)
MFRILQAGDWPPGRVRSVFEPNSRTRIPAVEAAIEAAWITAKARPGALLFDGPMCRLQSWSADAESLTLHLADCGYKPFFGTNISHPEFAGRYGPGVMANPVGVSPAVETSDGHLIMGRRNDSVAYYPGRIHPFAGCLEPGDPDVFAAVIRELSEELALNPGDIRDLRCTGVVSELNLKQTELIFAAAVSATRTELISRLDGAEHAAAWSVPATAADVAAVVNSPDALLTPVAVSALLLWGRLRFGQAWYLPLAAQFG